MKILLAIDDSPYSKKATATLSLHNFDLRMLKFESSAWSSRLMPISLRTYFLISRRK